MPDYAQPLGHTVKTARLKEGISQRRLANQLNMDARTVLNIENCRSNPKMEIIFPLIRALKIDPNAIFYPELYQDNPAVHQIQLLLLECSETEAEALLSVCKSVLAVLREKSGITIEE